MLKSRRAFSLTWPLQVVAAGLWIAGSAASSVALAPAATAPRATPATGPDLSSPQAVLTSLYTALRGGDIPAAKGCMHFSDPRQAETFELTMTQLWGPMKLLRAMERRFGEAGRKPFATAALDQKAGELLGRLNQVEFRVNGDDAVVVEKKAAINPSAEGELTGIAFRQEAGQWRVVASSFEDSVSDMSPAEMQMLRGMREAIGSACSGTIARLARGEFANAGEAYADYQARLLAASTTTRTVQAKDH